MKRKYHVPALERGIVILRLLSRSALPLQKISEQTKVPMASTLRILHTLIDEGLVIYNKINRTYKSSWILLPHYHNASLRNIIDETLNDIVNLISITAEWYHPLDETNLVLSSHILLPNAKIQAKVGFYRPLYDELEAVSRVALAQRAEICFDHDFWQWDETNFVSLSKERVYEIWCNDKKNNVIVDSSFNVHGVHRYAVAVLREGKLFGVLALAENKSDMVLGRDAFIKEKLEQVAIEMSKKISS